jgi:transcriptional regulator NrdR family protein
MLACPKCKSTDLKVFPSKPRDMPDGKTRSRMCNKCKMRFVTIETVIVLPPIEKPKPKTKPKPRNKKRILKPRLRLVPKEPDFSSMNDAEIEAYFYDDDL